MSCGLALLLRVMTRTTRSRGRQAQPQSLDLAFWRDVVLLVAALVPLATALIAFATGVIAPAGGSVFSSPFFWTFYGLLLMVITTTVANLVVLRTLRKRLLTRGYMLK